nr:acyltransferase [uncultured Faecalimonas sp.]
MATKKQRLFYLDFIRAIAAISIVITHFNARYSLHIPEIKGRMVGMEKIGNIGSGEWGVSLFFIISGAALMYVYERRDDWKQFYKKRFLSIYPMFWIAYGTVFGFYVLKNRAMIGAGIPKWRFIFTLLGVDGLLSVNGYATFYLLGEWFLGTIILLYLIFPVLKKLLNTNLWITIGLVVTGYVASLGICNEMPVVPATVLFIRLPEFVFGMIFVKLRWKSQWKTALPALLLIVVNGIFKPEIAGSIQTTYIGIASFLVLVFVSGLVKNKWIQKICEGISKYSYAVFLVHHIIIINVMNFVDLGKVSLLQSYLLFALISCMIAVVAGGLYKIHEIIMRKACTMKKTVV